MDISFVDYDSVRFHLSTPVKKTEIWLSMQVKCWADLVKYGALEILNREFGDWLSPQTEDGFDVTLKFEADRIPELGGQSKLCLSSLREL
jgi:actin related protein 2/3 complex subunit 2